MTGYFTAAKRIKTLAAVEVAEQLASMAFTMTALTLWADSDSGRACLCVVLGSSLGAILTLTCLVFLRIREQSPSGPRIPVSRDICRTALPLAAADDLRTGIVTVENLMVPKRLALHAAVENPLAAFGTLSGMVFPVLMFPACILFGLAELLIPELARCQASESRQRISYLIRRSLKSAMLYGVFFGGILFLLAKPLCQRLYQSSEAGSALQLYALLIPMLYCDAITDAMIKGLGQQAVSVRYNILTNILDVAFLYLLLPDYGMAGYFFSFLITHVINFALSLRRLLKITGEHIPIHIPLLTLSAGICAAWAASLLPFSAGKITAFSLLMGSLLYLSGIIRREDIQWIRSLLIRK
jgi:stage V sporulation protein B